MDPIRAEPRDDTQPRCPLCHAALVGRLFECPACHTRFHEVCTLELGGGCSTLGCERRLPGERRQDPLEGEQPRQPRIWVGHPVAVGAPLLFLAGLLALVVYANTRSYYPRADRYTRPPDVPRESRGVAREVEPAHPDDTRPMIRRDPRFELRPCWDGAVYDAATHADPLERERAVTRARGIAPLLVARGQLPGQVQVAQSVLDAATRHGVTLPEGRLVALAQELLAEPFVATPEEARAFLIYATYGAPSHAALAEARMLARPETDAEQVAWGLEAMRRLLYTRRHDAPAEQARAMVRELLDITSPAWRWTDRFPGRCLAGLRAAVAASDETTRTAALTRARATRALLELFGGQLSQELVRQALEPASAELKTRWEQRPLVSSPAEARAFLEAGVGLHATGIGSECLELALRRAIAICDAARVDIYLYELQAWALEVVHLTGDSVPETEVEEATRRLRFAATWGAR